MPCKVAGIMRVQTTDQSCTLASTELASHCLLFAGLTSFCLSFVASSQRLSASFLVCIDSQASLHYLQSVISLTASDAVLYVHMHLPRYLRPRTSCLYVHGCSGHVSDGAVAVAIMQSIMLCKSQMLLCPPCSHCQSALQLQ